MATPFPGMDPYLEHPALWEGAHHRLINAMANQLQPRLDPRYVTSVEERVYVDTAVVLEVEELEIHQTRIEILDIYNNLRLVALIELLSPSNKYAGPGRESYLSKQQEILGRDCHLIEIDLLRYGPHALSVPEWRVQELEPYDYLACVSRWPNRRRFERYARRLRQQLPVLKVPLAEPDPDVDLDLQAALEQVYWEGRYMWRVRYEESCEPPLAGEDQQWAAECWAAYRAAHPEWFPTAPPTNGASA